jgi:16S rRNA (cytosine1402-N4)-methyltransferase
MRTGGAVDTAMTIRHTSVLADECVAFMRCRVGGTYVDATLGSGGHARRLLEASPRIERLIGIDCDQDALQRARDTLSSFGARATIVHGNFRHLAEVLARLGVSAIDGIVFDFGVSTHQLKDPARGFSFMMNGDLDMRMDTHTPECAMALVNRLPAADLENILRTFGEERWARAIARAIRRQADLRPIRRTTELADLVARAIPARYRPGAIHPATKTFQALRIAVNDELGAIEQGLDAALQLLSSGGRMCVISFHSLEDRIVKTRFVRWERRCTCPPGMPVCTCTHRPLIRRITRKPVVPGEHERRANPRARSAKLRVAEKV